MTMFNQSNTSTSFNASFVDNILPVTITSFIIVIGTIGNFMIIYFIYKIPALHSYNNILIAHLAVADFLQVTLVLPMAIANSLLRPEIPPSLCQAFAYIFSFLITISLAATAAISIDRCLAVIYPYRYSASMKIKYIIIYIVLTWLLLAIQASIPLLGLQQYGFGEYKPISNNLQCWLDLQQPEKNRIAFIFVFTYLVVTISAIVISYAIIFFIACNKGITDVSIVGYVSLKRSIRTTALIVGSNLVCFMPGLIAITLSYFHQDDLPPPLSMTSSLLMYLNPAINPIIYTLTNAILRKKIKKYWGCKFCTRNLQNIISKPSVKIDAYPTK